MSNKKEPLYKKHIPLFPKEAKFLGSIDGVDYWSSSSSEGDQDMVAVFSDIEDDTRCDELFRRPGLTMMDRMAMHFGVELTEKSEAKLVQIIFKDWIEKTRGDIFVSHDLPKDLEKLGDGNIWTVTRGR